MPEILTESFCERCGTRYTFESATPRGAKLKGIKVLSRGLKNFVMSDDTSMDEAMAAARSESDRDVTTHQLDAFHKTFNFCMSCRQYTCGNCWNEVENQCLSCSPNLGHEIMPAPFPGLDATNGIAAIRTEPGANGHDGISPSGYTDLPTFDTSAWPSSDLSRPEDELDILIGDTPPADMLIGDTPPADMLIGDTPQSDMLIGDTPPSDMLIGDTLAPVEDRPPLDASPLVQASEASIATDAGSEPPAPAPAPEPVAIQPPVEIQPPIEVIAAEPAPDEHDARAAAAAAQTAALLQRFRPGQSLDEALAEYESEHQAIEAEAEPSTAETPAEPVAAAATEEIEPLAVEPAVEPEPVVAAEPEPVVAEAEPVVAAVEPVVEPEPVVAEAEPVVVEPEPLPEPAAAAAPVEQPPEPEPVAAEPSRVDVVEQPTWQIVAPEGPPSAEPPVATPPAAEPPVAPTPIVPPPTATPDPVQPAATAEPQWPTQPQWPQAQQSTNGLPYFGRPAIPTGGLESLWAESAREVTAAPAATARAGVQPCVSCGLSLSATARFCRRCGTRQG
jgi:hypothetical protein